MNQQNKKSLCQLKLPQGVEVEDVKEVRFKLKNRWIDGQVASNQCEVKFKPRVKPGLSLETPGKILYKAHSVDKFIQCLTRHAPNKNEPQKELGYKMPESQVISKESDKKQTPITTAMPKQVEKIKEKILPHTPNQNVKQQAIEKKLGFEINKLFSPPPNKPVNPLKILQAFNQVGYSGKNADPVRIWTPKTHERKDSKLTNLQILNHVTEDLETLTKKVQDIRKNLEPNKKDNPDHLKANIEQTFNPSSYQTPIKVAPLKPSIDEDTGLSKPRLSFANMEKLIENKTDQYEKSPAPVWGQVSPYLSKLMNTTNTESQYINVSKGLDFSKTFEPEINPENNLSKSNASQKSQKRKPGHLSNSIVFRRDITNH